MLKDVSVVYILMATGVYGESVIWRLDGWRLDEGVWAVRKILILGILKFAGCEDDASGRCGV